MFKFFLGNGYFVIKNQHATKNQNRRDKALPCLCYGILHHNHRHITAGDKAVPCLYTKMVNKNQHATKNQNRRDKALPCLCYGILHHNHRAVAVQRLYVFVRVVVSAALNEPYPERSRRVFVRTRFSGLKDGQDLDFSIL